MTEFGEEQANGAATSESDDTYLDTKHAKNTRRLLGGEALQRHLKVFQRIHDTSEQRVLMRILEGGWLLLAGGLLTFHCL
jgi:hypothetical protein